MGIFDQPFDDANHRALVTGAGNGIGRSIAQALTGEGVRTLFADVSAERVEAGGPGQTGKDTRLRRVFDACVAFRPPSTTPRCLNAGDRGRVGRGRRNGRSPGCVFNLRRILGQQRKKARQERHLYAVRHSQDECPVNSRGIEYAIVQQALLDDPKCASDGGRERQRSGGRPDAIRATCKKLVAEQFTKSIQRMAHGRLTDAQALGRARDVVFGVKDVECNKEIEVDAVELGIVDVQEVTPRRMSSCGGVEAARYISQLQSVPRLVVFQKKARGKAGPEGAEL